MLKDLSRWAENDYPIQLMSSKGLTARMPPPRPLPHA